MDQKHKKNNSIKLEIALNRPFVTITIGGHTYSLGQRGITLIEMIVVVAIIGVIGTVLYMSFNPATHLERARDAERERNLAQIKDSLDLYYSDHSCYPTQTESIPFGNEWTEGSEVYMQEVPQDPRCEEDSSQCYSYRADSSSCPQWYVLLGKVSEPLTSSKVCPLTAFSNCMPEGYDDETSICQFGGNINCSVLNSNLSTVIPLGSPPPAGSGATPTPTIPLLQVGSTATPIPTSTSVPTPTSAPTPMPATPIPTPTGMIAGAETYSIGMTNQPDIYSVTSNPYIPDVGETQTIYVSVSDTLAPVNSVTVAVQTDNTTSNLTLSLLSGTNTDGVWGISWIMNDTINDNYGMRVVARDTAGNSSTAELSYN